MTRLNARTGRLDPRPLGEPDGTAARVLTPLTGAPASVDRLARTRRGARAGTGRSLRDAGGPRGTTR